MRHNRLRDLIAKMLKEVCSCYDVRTEPHLLERNDGARLFPSPHKQGRTSQVNNVFSGQQSFIFTTTECEL